MVEAKAYIDRGVRIAAWAREESLIAGVRMVRSSFRDEMGDEAGAKDDLEQVRCVFVKASLRMTFQAVAYFERVKNWQDLCDCCGRMGTMLFRRERYREALPWYQRAVEVITRAFGADSREV